MVNIKYNPKLKELAKKLRNNSTLSEVLLWNKLKNRQIKELKFIRQKPIGNYIVDFFCKDLMLVIEVDGVSHYENEKHDKERDNNLKKLGIKVLRISDIQVKNNINGVVLEIKDWIDSYG